MKASKKKEYTPVTELHKMLQGKKFTLDCGHHVTFNTNLGSTVIIQNGKDLRIICGECGY